MISAHVLPFSWMALITCYNYPNVDCKISLIESYNKDPYQYMSEQIMQQGKTTSNMEKKTFACLVNKHLLGGKRSSLKPAQTKTSNKSCKATSLKARNREFAEYVGKMQSKFGKVAHVERERMEEKKEVIMEEWKRFARVVDR